MRACDKPLPGLREGPGILAKGPLEPCLAHSRDAQRAFPGLGQPKRMASVWHGEGPDALAETAALTVSSASSDGECYLDVDFSLKNSSE